MPIEIRELVIRSVLAPSPDEGGPGRQPGGADGAPAQPAAPDMDALVQECVRQVLLVLARERER